MFLNQLKQKEKQAFLILAHHIARSDGDFAEEEKAVIEKYCMEMQTDNIDYKEDDFDIYDVLSEFKSPRSKKIVILELMALIYSDDYLHEREREVLEKILEEFDLSYSLSIVYTEWAKTMLSLFKQGNALLDI